MGLSGARYLNQIRMSGLTRVMGIISLNTGVWELADTDLPGLAIFLVLFGVPLVLKPWLEEWRLVGKAVER